MNHHSDLNKIAKESLNSLIRLFILFSLIYYNGLIIGSISFYVVIEIYFWSIAIIFGFERLHILDNYFIYSNSTNDSVGGIFELSNFDSSKVEEAIIKNFLMRKDKLLANLIEFGGDYYWNTPQISKLKFEEKLKIAKSRIFHSVLPSRSAFDNFIRTEINRGITVGSSPIEFYIIKCSDSESKGFLFAKVDHTMADGLNLILLLGHLDDEFHMSKYPPFLLNTTNKLSITIRIYVWIKDFLGFLAIGFFSFLLNLYSKKTGFNFKSNTSIQTEENQYLPPISFNLGLLSKNAKENGFTLNEYLLGCIMTSFKKISPTSKCIDILIPVGSYKLCSTIEEVNLTNMVNGLTGQLELVSSFIDEKQRFKALIKKFMSATYKLLTNTINSHIFYRILNPQTTKLLLPPFISDVAVTNVPAQQKEIKIGGSISKNFHLVVFTRCKIIILINSYNGIMNVSMSLNRAYENQFTEFRNELVSCLTERGLSPIVN